MRTAKELAGTMAGIEAGLDIQLSQTLFRMRLVDDWKIQDGSRVLEIGCGQGDTTAVLADAVGSAGHVLAIDLAEPSYGAPVTLGEATRHLTNGPLGDRIEFRFGFDVLDPSNAFHENEFHAIVLAHCTWYFDSLDRLRRTLSAIRPWTKRLCLSEWDLEPIEIGQFGHLLAVLIQGQVEAFKAQSRANVRTPYSLEALREILKETGWSIESEKLIDAAGMDDGRWEIAECLANSLREADELQIPDKIRALTGGLVDVLRRANVRGENQALPAYSIVAVHYSNV